MLWKKQKTSPPLRGEISTYLKRLSFHLKRAFIPHAGNDHRPHALRTSALVTYGATLVALKLGVTALLFVTFPDAATFSQGNVSRIVELTNETRAAEGLPPLATNLYLNSVAAAKAEDMARKAYFSHYTPEGFAPWHFIDTHAYDYTVAGENLAMNFTEAESVHTAFMASPSHRSNILNSEFEDIGAAATYAVIDGKKTQLLVVFYGKKRTPTPPESKTSLMKRSDTISSTAKTGSALALENRGTAQEKEKTFSFSPELIVFPATTASDSTTLKLYDILYSFFLFFIAFLAVSLVINIVVKIRVQHQRLIAESLLLIAFIAVLATTKVHYVEYLHRITNIY